MSHNVGTDDETQDTAHITELLKDLHDRAKTVQAELNEFKQHLKTYRLAAGVETAHYSGQLKSELGLLQRLTAEPPHQSSYHIAKSSNLPFLEALWRLAKSQHKVIALQKRFYYPRSVQENEPPLQIIRPRRRRRGRTSNDVSCLVDLVADNGQTWYKVSLVNNTRLLFDLAKRGWEIGESESEGSHSSGSDSQLTNDEDVLPVVKTARDLAAAAGAIRIRTRKPIVKLVLPRIVEGETQAVDDILKSCRAAGVEVMCQPTHVLQSTPLSQALSKMAPSPFADFTEQLNIDCTILLALVSEFSHAKVSKEPWFHTALQRQVEIEDNENLLPSLLYPAMGSRKLFCTDEAAVRMQEIVDTIGTVSEKARTAIMMATGDAAGKSREELIREMQYWSAYQVPCDWQLPIEVVRFDPEDTALAAKLPREAISVCQSMTSINKSIFLFGWSSGLTTISSNKTIVKQMDAEFEKFDNVEETAWPKIWLCPTARSLVGKESRSANKLDAEGEINATKANSKKDGVMPLPDPLKRENQRRNGLDVLSLREGHEVVDLRPNGYDYNDVLSAKRAALYNAGHEVET